MLDIKVRIEVTWRTVAGEDDALATEIIMPALQSALLVP